MKWFSSEFDRAIVRAMTLFVILLIASFYWIACNGGM
jgi:hypothetical protein